MCQNWFNDLLKFGFKINSSLESCKKILETSCLDF